MRFCAIPRRCQQPSIGASADGLSDLLGEADPVAWTSFAVFRFCARFLVSNTHLFAPPQSSHNMSLQTADNMLVNARQFSDV